MKRLHTAVFAGLFAVSAFAQSTDQKIADLESKIQELDQRVRVSERLKEIKDEEADAKAKNTASVSADQGGFYIRSGDGSFALKIGADLQVDNRSFTGPGSALTSDTVLLRRLRPTFSGTVYRNVDFFFRPDFGGGTTAIYEAYIELKYVPRAKLRVGKFKPPVGLERLQADDDTNFVERGLPTLLVPSRDIGYQISGDIVSKRVNYAVGVFNGVPDNGLSDAAAGAQRDYSARLWLTPFAPSSGSPLAGLGFGAAISGGNADGITLPSYRTFGQAAFLPFATGVTQAGHRTRTSPQALYNIGSFGLLAEYVLAEEGFLKSGARRAISLRAWQTQVTYLLTGEKKTTASPTPKRVFDPAKHGWGAVELAARVSDFDAARALYDYGLVDPTKAARRAHEWVGGVNWYLNRMLRISLDYGRTNFTGGAVAGNRPAERVIIGRFQINFI